MYVGCHDNLFWEHRILLFSATDRYNQKKVSTIKVLTYKLFIGRLGRQCSLATNYYYLLLLLRHYILYVLYILSHPKVAWKSLLLAIRPHFVHYISHFMYSFNCAIWCTNKEFSKYLSINIYCFEENNDI